MGEDDELETFECPTCEGTGTICAECPTVRAHCFLRHAHTTCPQCDGAGEIRA
jgi:DnaJ-class molecular chaperone